MGITIACITTHDTEPILVTLLLNFLPFHLFEYLSTVGIWAYETRHHVNSEKAVL